MKLAIANLLTLRTSTYQVVEHTLVQLPLIWSALPKLLVVVLQARPVLSELRKAVLIYILDPIRTVSREQTKLFVSRLLQSWLPQP